MPDTIFGLTRESSDLKIEEKIFSTTSLPISAYPYPVAELK